MTKVQEYRPIATFAVDNNIYDSDENGIMRKVEIINKEKKEQEQKKMARNL